AWIEGLLDLRAKRMPFRTKVKKILHLTHAHIDLLPIIKELATGLKRVGWDDRGWAARLALSASAYSLIAFGGSGAGIAAFGGAIGLPLWIVFGASGAFAGMMIDELSTNPVEAPERTGKNRLAGQEEMALGKETEDLTMNMTHAEPVGNAVKHKA